MFKISIHQKSTAMKKFLVLFYSLIIAFSSFAFNSKNINEELLKSFNGTFPNAREVTWTESAENYVVNFMDNGIRTRITFTKDGNFLSSTRYYNGQKLPLYIFINLKYRYPGKTVFGVTEFATISSIEYFIKMEDSKSWYTIKTDNNVNFEIVEKYKKALE